MTYWWQGVKSYIQHWWQSNSRRGDGIHSPFVFSFITDIKNEKHPFYAYQQIEQVRNNLLHDTHSIYVTDYGTSKSRPRRICDIVKKSAKSKRQAQLLFRMVRTFQPTVIFELGTCLGTTTLYLAHGCKNAQVHTFEGCPQTAGIAQTNFNNLQCTNIQLHVGDINTTLPQALQQVSQVDFVFFDANHQKEPTLAYFQQCLSKVTPQSVFVFDDIHWSPSMEEAWNTLSKHPLVSVSIDLYHLGVLFFNPELKKQHYQLKL